MHEGQPAPELQPRADAAQVMLRVALRLALLAGVALLLRQDLARSMPTLLYLLAIFCAATAVGRREAIFGSMLTHWDEAAAYVVLSRIVTMLA